MILFLDHIINIIFILFKPFKIFKYNGINIIFVITYRVRTLLKCVVALKKKRKKNNISQSFDNKISNNGKRI